MIQTGEEMYIGIGLGRVRNERDWSQEKLSEVSELSYRAIQNLEYNRTSPSGTTICKLAKAFEMKPWEFLKDIEDEIIYKPRQTTILPIWLTQLWDQFWYYRRGRIKFHLFKVGDTYQVIASNGIITVVNCYGSTPAAAKEMALFKLIKAMAGRGNTKE